jgi:hypothetical protein
MKADYANNSPDTMSLRTRRGIDDRQWAQTTLHVVWANSKFLFFSIVFIILIYLISLAYTSTTRHPQTTADDTAAQTMCNVVWANSKFLFFFYCIYYTNLPNLFSLYKHDTPSTNDGR